MNEPVSYEIKTVNDFFQIPVDRIADCLEEFQTSIELTHAIAGLAKLDGPNEIKSFAIPSFTWIDDGLKQQNMRFGEINCKLEPKEAAGP